LLYYTSSWLETSTWNTIDSFTAQRSGLSKISPESCFQYEGVLLAGMNFYKQEHQYRPLQFEEHSMQMQDL